MYAADSSAHQAIQTKTPGLPVVLLRHPQTVQTVQTVKCRKICRTTAHVSLMKASAAATVAWYSVLPSLSYSLSILPCVASTKHYQTRPRKGRPKQTHQSKNPKNEKTKSAHFASTPSTARGIVKGSHHPKTASVMYGRRRVYDWALGQQT